MSDTNSAGTTTNSAGASATSTATTIGRSSYPATFEQCEDFGGHCFERTGFVYTVNPPQYPEECKHCGATRTGYPQPDMSYSEPVPRRSQGVQK